jgi:predicted dithiol-disulfide oxidoreductase (DUF899 family)
VKKRKGRAAPRKQKATIRIGGVARKVVSPREWRRARAAMTTREKKHMRAMDALAAARRRMPWMKIDKPYVFDGPRGWASLVDLFEGRTQLVLYHFMFGPKVGGWPHKGCVGCSFVADQISHLDHIRARDITFAMVSAVPFRDIARLRERYGWKRWAWYSASAEFNSGLNVFYRDGKDVYRTHFVARRGLEAFGTAWSFFDVVPLGRQEKWQDAPAGSPQGEPYTWWRRHGEYDPAGVGGKG